MTKTTQYKNTVIGPIPIDWEVKKLGEVVDKIAGGGTPSRLNEEYWDGDIFWATVKDLNSNKLISTIEKISDLGLSNSSATLVKKGNLIIATRMALGKIVKNEIDVAINQDLKALYFKNNVINEFGYYWYESNNEKINDFGTGSTVKGISLIDLRNLTFPLPPLLEQQKIAEILSTWDKAIQETDAIIKKLEDRNKALAFSLLTGKKRIEGFEDKWDNYKLEHFFEEYSSKPNGKIDLPVFTSSKNGLMSQSDYYSGGRISSRENVDYNVIPFGFITYRSRSDDGLFTFNKNTTGYDGLISGYYPVFKVVNGNDNFFLNYLNFLKNRLTKYSTGTSQLVLSFKALKNAKFNLPSLEEQNAIAEILNTANQEVKQYQQKLEAFKLQKKGLMQQLLTGKVRTI